MSVPMPSDDREHVAILDPRGKLSSAAHMRGTVVAVDDERDRVLVQFFDPDPARGTPPQWIDGDRLAPY